MKIEGERPTAEPQRHLCDMVEAAAQKIGADVFWHGNKPHPSLRFCATLKLDGEEVCVDTSDGPKYGVRIESDSGERHWHYETLDKLAKAVKTRVVNAKARTEREDAEREVKRLRNLQMMETRRAAQDELTKLYGEKIVGTCVSVDADVVDGAIRLGVQVFCGRIRAKGLSLSEAVRFIQVLISAGYDMAAETEKLYPST